MKSLILPITASMILAACAQPVTRMVKAPPASHSYTSEQLKIVSDDVLCRDIALYPTTPLIRAEKERRKLDCSATMMAVVQTQEANHLARSQAQSGPSFWQGVGQSMVMMNSVMSQQQANTPPPVAPPHPTNTNCRMIGNAMHCTTW